MNSSKKNLISGSGLWKSFKCGDEAVSLIKGLDFYLAESGSISIMGDSGSGKSTLLNLLSGLDSLTREHSNGKGELLKTFQQVIYLV